jgi:hypothetical protein
MGPDLNFPAFHDAANKLRALGCGVLNPADFGADENESWADCLKRDLAILVHADVVVTLPGWQNSKGARLETHVAAELGIPVVELDDYLWGATAAKYPDDRQTD